MTDAELIAQLRSWDGTPFDDDAEAAADRIEAQAAEIERLRSALKKTEAQPLVLESVARGPMEGESMTSWIRYHMKEARATLAELTGDKP